MNTNSNSVKIQHSVFLLLAAFFWGTTFVAQDVAMKFMQPFTFNACRFLLGAVVLFPVAFFTGRIDPLAVNYRGGAIPGISAGKKDRAVLLLTGGFFCGLCVFLAGGIQQVGIVYTTAGKSGFVTALYIVLVPVIGRFIGRRCTPLIWLSILIAVIGFYLLCIKENFSVNRGDLITLGSSFMFAMHILTVDRFSPKCSGVQLSCIQFLFAGLLSLVTALLLETPDLASIGAALAPILYSAVLSSGVAYTLQIIGQRGLNPTLASLLMSVESVISVLAGWVILGDTLTAREILGCILVFTAVILAQLPAPRIKKADPAR
jgi:drug/metabolite transporter (DMT)-like permease